MLKSFFIFGFLSGTQEENKSYRLIKIFFTYFCGDNNFFSVTGVLTANVAG
jgi:hypothetical protein